MRLTEARRRTSRRVSLRFPTLGPIRLPNVGIGILPLTGQARVLYPDGFQVYADRDDDADTLVLIELVPDELRSNRKGR